MLFHTRTVERCCPHLPIEHKLEAEIRTTTLSTISALLRIALKSEAELAMLH